MKIKKNGKTVNLTEGDIKKIVKKYLTEEDTNKDSPCMTCIKNAIGQKNINSAQKIYYIITKLHSGDLDVIEAAEMGLQLGGIVEDLQGDFKTFDKKIAECMKSCANTKIIDKDF